MDMIKKIFDRFVVLMAVTFLFAGAGNAANYGCDISDNDAVIPELALCSTHVYNIGKKENVDGDLKRHMQDVVRLKTTVITQQMYKQYEEMESMLRRLRTQLRKATLAVNLQVNGADADDDDSGGGGTSKDKYVILNGAQNCLRIGELTEAVDCLQKNLDKILSALDANNTTDARRQLLSDLNVGKNLGLITIEGTSGGNGCSVKTAGQNGEEKTMCTKVYCAKEYKKATVVECVYELISVISRYNDNRKTTNNKNMQMMRQNAF